MNLFIDISFNLFLFLHNRCQRSLGLGPYIELVVSLSTHIDPLLNHLTYLTDSLHILTQSSINVSYNWIREVFLPETFYKRIQRLDNPIYLHQICHLTFSLFAGSYLVKNKVKPV